MTCLMQQLARINQKTLGSADNGYPECAIKGA
jgi:hypothetical protein